MTNLQLLVLENPKGFMQQLLDLPQFGGDMETFLGDGYRDVMIDDQRVQWKIVESEGGNEGEGEYVERILMIMMGDQTTYLKTTGFYDSWAGTEWYNDWKIVYPRSVSVTKYFDTP